MLSPAVWLGLKPEMRRKLSLVFNIPKSGVVEVINNAVVSDGYTPKDLMAVTIEKLQVYTGMASTDFYKLFDIAVNKIDVDSKPKAVIAPPKEKPAPVVIPQPKNARKKAKA